jgi:hypothetical protein
MSHSGSHDVLSSFLSTMSLAFVTFLHPFHPPTTMFSALRTQLARPLQDTHLPTTMLSTPHTQPHEHTHQPTTVYSAPRTQLARTNTPTHPPPCSPPHQPTHSPPCTPPHALSLHGSTHPPTHHHALHLTNPPTHRHVLHPTHSACTDQHTHLPTTMLSTPQTQRAPAHHHVLHPTHSACTRAARDSREIHRAGACCADERHRSQTHSRAT